MKYFNYKTYNFNKFFRKLNFRKYDFLKFISFTKFKQQFISFIKFKQPNLKKIYKYLIDLQYEFLKIIKQKIYKYYKASVFYLIGTTLALIVTYLAIPFFYNYNKSNIENLICEDFEVKCNVKGKIYYNFIPTPRLIIKNVQVNSLTKEKNILAKIKRVDINLPLKDLYKKSKKNLNKIQLKKAKLFINYEKIDEYKNLFLNKKKSNVISFKKSDIDFFDGSKYITSINKINGKYKYKKNYDKLDLKGIFLGDNINIDFESDLNAEKDLVIKLKELNFLTKVNFIITQNDKSSIEGKILIKKGKNKITSIFTSKDNEIIIKQANVRNSFSDGKILGKIKLKPFFDFDLNIDLKSLNFYILSKYINALDDENKKNLFLINKKINGKINLNTDKMFSKKTLINSFESQIQFINGNIMINKLLLGMGKLGAADLNGVIKNDKNFTNLKFSTNVFIDNSKRFFNKFGVYNKEKKPLDMFISGNLDLTNFKIRFFELSSELKFNNEDIAFIENEFNDSLLVDGYESLFDFSNFKKFIRSVSMQEK